MKQIKNFFNKLANYVKGGALSSDLNKAAEIAIRIGPMVKIAGDVATGITPSAIDNVLWFSLTQKYPKFFDGSLKTPDEMKLLALATLTELARAKFPEANTTIARLAAQAAYQLHTADVKN